MSLRPPCSRKRNVLPTQRDHRGRFYYDHCKEAEEHNTVVRQCIPHGSWPLTTLVSPMTHGKKSLKGSFVFVFGNLTHFVVGIHPSVKGVSVNLPSSRAACTSPYWLICSPEAPATTLIPIELPFGLCIRCPSESMFPSTKCLHR